MEKDKKKASKKSGEEAIVKNSIEINPKLEEAKGDTAVIGWGRMNPITSGHEKLVNKIKEIARKQGATPHVFLTHTQDAKKNPLSYDDKVMLAQKAFGNIIHKSKSKTIMQAMAELQAKYNKIILVVGADRIKEFDTLLNKYNGKDYSFDSIEVVSAGDRADPDSEEAKSMTADAMSASVMRKLASEGDFEKFKKGLPKKLVPAAKEIYDMVRSGMKIAEELEAEDLLGEALDYQQRRKRGLVMRKYARKIALARKKASKKLATSDQIKGRARKAAIKILRKKVAGEKGAKYDKLSAGEKMIIDKKVIARQAAVDKIAKRLLPTIKKQDRMKFSKKNVNESFEELFLETPTKRYHEARKKDGSMKFDRRFRAFRKITEDIEIVDIVDQISSDIAESVELHEEKAIKALQEKAEKSGIDFEEILAVYNEALEEDDHQWAFSCVNHFIAEKKLEKDEDDPCWKGYVQLGTKKKDGKEVPNCVPKEEVDLDEETTMQGIKRILSKTTHKKRYAYAKDLVQKIVDRKRKEGNGKLRHTITWYAATVADQVPGIDARILASMVEETQLDEMTFKKNRGDKTWTARQHIDQMEYHETKGRGAKGSLKKHHEDEAKWHRRQAEYKMDGYKSSHYYKEENGAGDEGTDKLVKKYKKDTPMENVNESFEAMFEEVTQKQIKDLERFADRLLDKFGVDVEFTRHFADRMNDERNNPAITIAELQKLFKKIAKNKAKDIKANADSEAVLKDIQSDLNLPVVIKFNRSKEEFEIVNKTIMRKKNFKTSNKTIEY